MFHSCVQKSERLCFALSMVCCHIPSAEIEFPGSSDDCNFSKSSYFPLSFPLTGIGKNVSPPGSQTFPLSPLMNLEKIAAKLIFVKVKIFP